MKQVRLPFHSCCIERHGISEVSVACQCQPSVVLASTSACFTDTTASAALTDDQPGGQEPLLGQTIDPLHSLVQSFWVDNCPLIFWNTRRLAHPILSEDIWGGAAADTCQDLAAEVAGALAITAAGGFILARRSPMTRMTAALQLRISTDQH